MGILDKMFKWFTAKDKDGNEMNLGYVLEGEPKDIADVEKVFKAFNLEKYFGKIKPLLKPKIDLTLIPATEDDFKNAISKIGGQPHLPKDFVWPKNENGKSLSFIGQINFAEVSEFDKTGLLPKDGLAAFFYCADQEAWGFDPKDRNRFKIVYIAESKETVKHNFPSDLESHSIFKPNRLTYSDSLSIPTWEEDSINGLIDDADSDNYFELSGGSENQILGYANCVQGTMELECQLVTNGLYCGDASGYENPLRKELEAGASDWLLLLQIDSEEEKAGMMWGDCGKIYFWIKKSDLLKKNFDNAWCILQCY
ncbi:MAG: DUF1963 domain-containing protein [Bacteroidetes bacterium]|nr:DUF1963 domain-containing protein [Bacteroidota bacterium]